MLPYRLMPASLTRIWALALHLPLLKRYKSITIRRQRTHLQERKEAAEERRRNKRKEKLPAPSSSDVEGQRVLTEAFCINRLDSIRQMVGSTKLGIFADGKDHSARAEQIAQFFGEFMRQNAEDDSPYFCVSAPILGRLMHTFRDNYISRGTATAVDFDLTQHVDEIVEKAKESMLEDASAIRLRRSVRLRIRSCAWPTEAMWPKWTN